MTLTSVTNIVSQVYEKATKFVDSKKGQQAIDLITFLMECVEEYKMSGESKRDIVRNVLIKVMETRQIGDGTVNQQVKTILTSNMYEGIVSAIASAAKGKLNINREKVKKAFRFCPCF